MFKQLLGVYAVQPNHNFYGEWGLKGRKGIGSSCCTVIE